MTSVRTRRNGANGNGMADMVRKEITQRAALYYRLGYSETRATKRVLDNVHWDAEVGATHSPSDDDVKALVAATYKRRPTR